MQHQNETFYHKQQSQNMNILTKTQSFFIMLLYLLFQHNTRNILLLLIKKETTIYFPYPDPLLKVSHQNSSFFLFKPETATVETARPCPRRCTKEYFSIPWMSDGNPQPSENSTHGNPWRDHEGFPSTDALAVYLTNQSISFFSCVCLLIGIGK